MLNLDRIFDENRDCLTNNFNLQKVLYRHADL
jgi:hypothetical protein